MEENVDTAKMYKELVTDAIKKLLAAEEQLRETNQELVKKMESVPKATLDDENVTSKTTEILSAVEEKIKTTPANVPTTEQMIPVVEAAYKSVAPNIKYIHKVDGKKFFYCGVALFILAIAINSGSWCMLFTEAKEKYAHRNYLAAVDLEDPNPGSWYHSVIELWDAGDKEEVKNIVRSNEISAKDHGKTTKEFQQKLTAYLANVEEFSGGIKVTGWVTNKKPVEDFKVGQLYLVFFKKLSTQEHWKAVINPYNYVQFSNEEALTMDFIENEPKKVRFIGEFDGHLDTPLPAKL